MILKVLVVHDYFISVQKLLNLNLVFGSRLMVGIKSTYDPVYAEGLYPCPSCFKELFDSIESNHLTTFGVAGEYGHLLWGSHPLILIDPTNN
jgi:hypothetical protein